jgi:hypothetical protein
MIVATDDTFITHQESTNLGRNDGGPVAEVCFLLTIQNRLPGPVNAIVHPIPYRTNQ